MKTIIDIDEVLYQRLEAEAAWQGRTVRDLVADGVRHVLDASDMSAREPPQETPPWFGALGAYADNARGEHELAAVWRSIASRRRV